jgi:hypothetical protein
MKGACTVEDGMIFLLLSISTLFLILHFVMPREEARLDSRMSNIAAFSENVSWSNSSIGLFVKEFEHVQQRGPI